jgi:hypothetical protein
VRTFTDKSGRTWDLNIRVGDVERVRDLAKVDLLRIVRDGGELMDSLGEDLVLLVSVLWALIQPQAQAAAISEPDFRAAMFGDVLDEGSRMLLEELADFFPAGPRGRLQSLIQRQSRWEEHLTQLIETSGPSGPTSTPAPASAGPTPPP